MGDPTQVSTTSDDPQRRLTDAVASSHPEQSAPNWTRGLWGRGFVALCYAVVTLAFDYYVLHKLLHAEDRELAVAAAAYPILSRALDRPVGIRKTTVLELGKEPGEPSLDQSVCDFRRHVAEAIMHSVPLSPAVIIVDLRFAINVTCDKADDQLREAGYGAREKGIHVYFGTTLKPSGDGVRSAIMPRKLCESKGACTAPTAPGLVGLMEMPKDPRKVALGYADSHGKPYETITWLAARNRVSDIVDRPAIAAGMSGTELFHSMLSESDYRAKGAVYGWSGFQKLVQPNELSGTYLLIGSSEDRPPAGGAYEDSPGYYQHASALEALIDDRTWVRVPWVVELIVAFFFWFLMDFVSLPWKPVAAVGGLLVLICANLVLAHGFGLYGDFALISTIGLGIISLELLTGWLHACRAGWSRQSELSGGGH